MSENSKNGNGCLGVILFFWLLMLTTSLVQMHEENQENLAKLQSQINLLKETGKANGEMPK